MSAIVVTAPCPPRAGPREPGRCWQTQLSAIRPAAVHQQPVRKAFHTVLTAIRVGHVEVPMYSPGLKLHGDGDACGLQLSRI